MKELRSCFRPLDARDCTGIGNPAGNITEKLIARMESSKAHKTLSDQALLHNYEDERLFRIIDDSGVQCRQGRLEFILPVKNRLQTGPMRLGWTRAEVLHGQCSKHGFTVGPKEDSCF